MIYAGFDRAACPSLDMMARLKKNTNLVWCGYYLPAPSQSGAGWTGKRAALVAQGWGLAPIFVGQQVVGPGSHAVSAAQGGLDGDRACAAMHAEGFPSGSFVYLDLENGLPFTTQQRAYVGAWTDAVTAAGFRPGVYCSHTFAKEVSTMRPRARIWAFRVATVDRRPVDGLRFPTPDPKDVCSVAVMLQRAMNVELTGFDNLVVDLDCSTMRDPSAPESAVEPQVATAPPVDDPGPLPPPAVRLSLLDRFRAWFASL